MNKDTKYFGIDISAAVFDATDSHGIYHQFNITTSGFRSFLKLLGSNNHCVMEATGYYHYRLAYCLVENTIRISVENPLFVKRFIQMKLSEIKTDKSDSKSICEHPHQVDFNLKNGKQCCFPFFII